MAAKEDIERIIRQEQELVFEQFDEDLAAELLTRGRARANAAQAPIGFLVKLWDRPLAFGATRGYSHHNYLWCHRKTNTVRLVHKSTYRLVLERGDKPRVFDESWGVDASEYVIAGGAFPISIKGAGFIGAVAASGLPERDDHALVVAAVCDVLGKDYSQFALD
ncbi:MAG: heme-binding protein [Hyphomicrobiaceae bacterium]|nr:heme-binding protein [Hyphomicrobiaceae bacterium]